MTIEAWHFVDTTLRNGQPIPQDGVLLKYDGNLRLCKSGLHASRLALDALKYAPGTTCCRVLCGGDILEGDDKLVCSERTILWRVDAAKILKQFARQCALDVVHLWNPSPVVLEFLHGDQSKAAETAAEAWATWSTRTSAAAAAAAAAEAAWAAEVAEAAWSTWSAAEAAWTAAEAAWAARTAAAEAWAWAATWAATWAARAARAARAAGATWSTARTAEGAAVTRESQNDLLEKMLLKT